MQQVPAGDVCAALGLSGLLAGDTLGDAAPDRGAALEPVMSYCIRLPADLDPQLALPKLRLLEEEEPQLRMVWDARLREIRVQLMGAVQLEILQSLIRMRFGWDVTFDTGRISYRETIAAPVEGVGHFEPLRHYAEVHLILAPLPQGSGLVFDTVCSEDVLDRNWQRLILTHLQEKQHLGVLTGSPVTDLRITLAAGRAHLKHTEGGDFRQATYRAVRQGLMKAQSVLLEPWYAFRMELPAPSVGRAITDIQRMQGEYEPPEQEGEQTILRGSAPVRLLREYQTELTAYTRGRGRIQLRVSGYRPCREQEQIVKELGYDPARDLENPASSVFCAHGAGYEVKWQDVDAAAHLPLLRFGGPAQQEPQRIVKSVAPGGAPELEKELLAIFERTYGKVERQAFQPQKKPARTSLDEGKYHIRDQKTGPEYLLVDGYNIIFAWEELEAVARQDVAAARAMLTNILSNYQGYRKCVVILVFDAYKVKGNPGSVEKVNNIYVVYTKEAETADAYIEKATYDLQKEHRVRVATSDGLEQLIILGHGALRLSARAFKAEVEQAQGEISGLIRRHNRSGGREQNQLRSTAQVKKREETP